MVVLLSLLFFLITGSATTPPRTDVSVLEQIKALRASITALSKRVDSYSEHCGLITEGTCGPCQCKDDRRLLKKYYCDCSGLPPKRDCLQFYQQEIMVNGVYKIHQNNLKTIQVYCDQSTDGGGWTVFQRRQDGSVNFYRDWLSYKEGFGDLQHEFWLGNEQLFTMTLQALYPSGSELRVELEDWEGVKRYAKYRHFQVGNEFTKYTINVGGYSGNAGDGGNGMMNYNSMKFTTYDQDNDENPSGNCAAAYKAGWWYKNCYSTQLNGRYYFYKDKNPDLSGIRWSPFHSTYDPSIKFTEMKMRRKT